MKLTCSCGGGIRMDSQLNLVILLFDLVFDGSNLDLICHKVLNHI